MGIGIDLKPIITAINRMSAALERQAAAQEQANRIAEGEQ